jgi:hypothetical protein
VTWLSLQTRKALLVLVMGGIELLIISVNVHDFFAQRKDLPQ